jgi:hypothetical protein
MLTSTDRGVERAAQAIVELINSRPYSPRREEIADVIKQLAIEQATAPSSSPDRDGLDEYGPDLTKLAP